MSHYNHLTIEKVKAYYECSLKVKKFREIAKALERSLSTLCSELPINCIRKERLFVAQAEKNYKKRREKSDSCPIMSVDRKPRFTLGKGATQEVEDGVVATLMQLPPETCRSLTSDRGKEFVTYTSITNRTGRTSFYFPRLHAPRERETNENINGLLREFVSRGMAIKLSSPINKSRFLSTFSING